jgi:CheY-like chemotaxis protein
MVSRHRFDLNFPESVTEPLVLVVDDSEDNLQLLVQLLELMQYSCVTATNGQTTIEKAKSYQPNLILLDIMLPDISGVEVVHHLKQEPQTEQIPIVAVTAMARSEDRESFLAAGCVECVTKPYDIDALEALIRRYVFC